MPNWAGGEVTLFGDVENILKFFQNQLDGSVTTKEISGGGREVTLENDMCIKETDRCFALGQKVLIKNVEKDLKTSAMINIECAWDMDADAFGKISQHYKLDLIAWVDEPGMGFSHYFECKQGNVQVDEVTEYVDRGEE